jgi:hypothetical protein
MNARAPGMRVAPRRRHDCTRAGLNKSEKEIEALVSALE